jgi:hypothetical protein
MTQYSGDERRRSPVTALELIGRLLTEGEVESLAGGLVLVMGPECKGHGCVTIEIRNGGVLYISKTIKDKPEKRKAERDE